MLLVRVAFIFCWECMSLKGEMFQQLFIVDKEEHHYRMLDLFGSQGKKGETVCTPRELTALRGGVQVQCGLVDFSHTRHGECVQNNSKSSLRLSLPT
jgi:hypothetical protein